MIWVCLFFLVLIKHSAFYPFYFTFSFLFLILQLYPFLSGTLELTGMPECSITRPNGIGTGMEWTTVDESPWCVFMIIQHCTQCIYDWFNSSTLHSMYLWSYNTWPCFDVCTNPKWLSYLWKEYMKGMHPLWSRKEELYWIDTSFSSFLHFKTSLCGKPFLI